MLDKTFFTVQDKYLKKRCKPFSLSSTILTLRKVINQKEFMADPRSDDIYVKAEDGEDFLPPPADNVGLR